MTNAPMSNPTPPSEVMTSALMPPATALGSSLSKAMSANEQNAVIYQNKNRNRKLPVNASPAIAPMNSSTSS